MELRAGEGNSVTGTVAHVTYLGEIEQYELKLSPTVLVKAFEQNPQTIRRPGEPVTAHIRPENLLVLPAQ